MTGKAEHFGVPAVENDVGRLEVQMQQAVTVEVYIAEHRCTPRRATSPPAADATGR